MISELEKEKQGVLVTEIPTKNHHQQRATIFEFLKFHMTNVFVEDPNHYFDPSYKYAIYTDIEVGAIKDIFVHLEKVQQVVFQLLQYNVPATLPLQQSYRSKG